MTNTHSTYGLGRNFITYITRTTLLHLGAVIFIKLYITRLLNESVGLVENTVSMRVCSITNKYALMSSSLEFRQTDTFLENETLTPEHLEVLEIGLVPGEYLIQSLVQAFAEIEPIGCMTSCVDGFSPKVVWRLELCHHGPCRIHQRPVLPLCNTILLRGIWCRVLMLDPFITKKLIQGVVLELSAVVTSYCQDLRIMLTVSFICKVDDGLLGLTLPLEEVYPSVS